VAAGLFQRLGWWALAAVAALGALTGWLVLRGRKG
jgi:hypothetical protein